MKNFKNLIKEAHLGNPLNEEDRATRVDKMMSGEYDDEDYKDSKRYDDVRVDLDEEIDDEDIVIYDGEEHIIMSRDGNMIYIRPLEDSAILGKRDVIKVPARALAYKSDLDKMYDEYKPKDEMNEVDEKWDKIARSSKYGKPWMELSIAQKQEILKAMPKNKAAEKEFERRMSMNEKIDYDEVLNLRAIKVEIEDEITQLRMEMEDEGDESKANYYGGKLKKLEDRLYRVQKQLYDYDMNESVNEDLDIGHQDDEPSMLKSELARAGQMIQMLYRAVDKYDDIEGEVDFPQWWQAKIIKANTLLDSAFDYLAGEEDVARIDAMIDRIDMDESDLDEGTCGYGEDGVIGDEPAGPDLNEDEIPMYLTSNDAFIKAVEDSVSYNDFEKRVYGILGNKYFKLAKIENPDAFKDFYDSIRGNKPKMEEAFDLDIDNAHSGDAALNRTVGDMGYNESLNKSLKEALNKRLGK